MNYLILQLLSLIALSVSEDLKDSEAIASSNVGIWPNGWVGQGQVYDVKNIGYDSKKDKKDEGYSVRTDNYGGILDKGNDRRNYYGGGNDYGGRSDYERGNNYRGSYSYKDGDKGYDRKNEYDEGYDGGNRYDDNVYRVGNDYDRRRYRSRYDYDDKYDDKYDEKYDCDEKSDYECRGGRTEKEYEEQREIYGGQGYERIWYPKDKGDKDDYRWRIIGRHGLGFEKRFTRASGLRQPITPEALSFVGKRPYYEPLFYDYN